MMGHYEALKELIAVCWIKLVLHIGSLGRRFI